MITGACQESVGQMAHSNWLIWGKNVTRMIFCKDVGREINKDWLNSPQAI